MTYTDQNAERHGIIRLGAAERCAQCGEPAWWVSIGLEAPVCGPDCHAALWREYWQAQQRIPADGGRALSIWTYTTRTENGLRRRAVVEAWSRGRLLFTLTVDAERLVELVRGVTRPATQEEKGHE